MKLKRLILLLKVDWIVIIPLSGNVTISHGIKIKLVITTCYYKELTPLISLITTDWLLVTPPTGNVALP